MKHIFHMYVIAVITCCTCSFAVFTRARGPLPIALTIRSCHTNQYIDDDFIYWSSDGTRLCVFLASFIYFTLYKIHIVQIVVFFSLLAQCSSIVCAWIYTRYDIAMLQWWFISMNHTTYQIFSKNRSCFSIRLASVSIIANTYVKPINSIGARCPWTPKCVAFTWNNVTIEKWLHVDFV